MPYDYADEAALAIELIEEYGRPMNLVVTTASETPGPAWDPEATETSTVETTTVVNGVQTFFSALERGGGLVEEGDIKILLDSAVEPPNDARIDEYSIVNVEPIKPGGVVVLYKVHARR